jgi:thiol-disulfide isomerase/thioredoxin
MHRSSSLLLPLLLLPSCLPAALHAQSTLRLPGCEVDPEVQRVLDTTLDRERLDAMPFAERFALQQKTLEELIAKYPRELEPYTELRFLLIQFSSDAYAQMRDRWISMAKEHPGDPLALLLASEVLDGVDTPQSIRLLEAARARAPEFPWAARDLAGIYVDGKLANPVKAKENIDAFFAMCPASSDEDALYVLASADPALQPRVTAARAAALRAKLEREADQQQLRSYSTLWTLEFQMRKPEDYGAEREQIGRDLTRMQKLHPFGDAAWQALIISGYKQSGAPNKQIAALQDKLIASYPHSNQAYGIVKDRWDKAHPEPQDQRDAAAWDQHRKIYEEALQEWIRQYPNQPYLRRNAWLLAVADDDTIPEKEVMAAVDAFLRATQRYEGPNMLWIYYPEAIQLLLERGWEPERAIDLVKQDYASAQSNLVLVWKSDDLTDEQIKEKRDSDRQDAQFLDGLLLKAAVEANKPEIAVELQAEVEAPPPEKKDLLEGYWTNRARLAQLTGRKIDALAYYQSALQTRVEVPKFAEGRLRDELSDEAHALWKREGGTDLAWATWSGMPAPNLTAQAAGPWVRPTKSLPAFVLTDISGKTWRLADLHGKAVFIDVWATWCGACLEELPNLEKLYEQVKGRSDIQILTFDTDSNPGTVGPFMKEKGYTFPVLLIGDATQLANTATAEGLPQNWVLDGTGTAQWRQTGYDPENYDDYSQHILARLAAATANK